MGKYYLEKKMKKALKKLDIPKESKRGELLLTESYKFKDLYLHSANELDDNTYFRMYTIFAEMAAYDFGFKDADDMEIYILKHGGRDCNDTY